MGTRTFIRHELYSPYFEFTKTAILLGRVQLSWVLVDRSNHLQEVYVVLHVKTQLNLTRLSKTTVQLC